MVATLIKHPSRDLEKKRDLYARHRVPEYWVVDPNEDRVLVYLLGEKGYVEPTILGPSETLTTDHIPGLTLVLTALLHP